MVLTIIFIWLFLKYLVEILQLSCVNIQTVYPNCFKEEISFSQSYGFQLAPCAETRPIDPLACLSTHKGRGEAAPSRLMEFCLNCWSLGMQHAPLTSTSSVSSKKWFVSMVIAFGNAIAGNVIEGLRGKRRQHSISLIYARDLLSELIEYLLLCLRVSRRILWVNKFTWYISDFIGGD